MELVPLGDRVLLRDLDRADLTDQIGSIILPRSYTDEQQSYMTGEIVNVGPLVHDLVPGMRVIHRQFRDLPVLHLRACSVEDILGIIAATVNGENWTFTPIGSRVAIQPEECEGSSLGAVELIVPDPWRKPSLRGRVASMGPKTSTLRVGDLVLYPPSIGSALELAGEQLLIFKEDEILATMESEENE